MGLPTKSPDARGAVRPDRDGFSILGFSVALFLLSVAAAVAVPAIQRQVRHARARATAADIRQFHHVFQYYARIHGNWPRGTTTPGAIPAGMTSALAGTDWTRPTPIGGRYIWLTHTAQRGERLHATIAIVSVTGNAVSDDRRELTLIDRLIDDGNLTMGRFRLGFDNTPLYVLEH